MGTTMTAIPQAQDAGYPASSERQPRDLTQAERKVRMWIRRNHGVLSSVARQFGLSVQFVQRIAYSRDAQSKGLRVERRLKDLGCPMIRRIGR